MAIRFCRIKGRKPGRLKSKLSCITERIAQTGHDSHPHERADLEKHKVIAGMSGSPVYIDGKLIGALAYGWNVENDPLGGVYTDPQ